MALDRDQLELYPKPSTDNIIQVRFYGDIEDCANNADIEFYWYPNLMETYDDWRKFKQEFTNKLVRYYHPTSRNEVIQIIEDFCDRLCDYRILELDLNSKRIVCPVGWIQGRRDAARRGDEEAGHYRDSDWWVW